MDGTSPESVEDLIISRFRELSTDGKQRLVDYIEFLCKKEKFSLETEHFLSDQERDSLNGVVREIQKFSRQKATIDAQRALQELCAGVFESEENLASNHDFFLYGAPKRK